AATELMQGERWKRGLIEGRPRVERIISNGVECAPAIIVGAGLRDYIDLRPAGGPALCRIHCGADAQFGNRIEGDVESSVRLLCLFLYAAGVYSVKGEVAVVKRVVGEADGALSAVAVVDRARDQQHQAGPIAPADRDVPDLGRVDQATHFRRTA